MMDMNKKFLVKRAAEAVGNSHAGLTCQYVFVPEHSVDRSLGAISETYDAEGNNITAL
jgi:hypothetical protein